MALHEEVSDDDLTLVQVEEMERSDDPADRERASRVMMKEAMHGPFVGIGNLQIPDLIGQDWGSQWRERMREQQRAQDEELERTMKAVAEATARRNARQARAEDATIESAELLDSLVSLASAQSAQLASVSTLLEVQAMQAFATAEMENQRWPRTWRVMVWTLVAGCIAAVGAVGAIAVTLLRS